MGFIDVSKLGPAEVAHGWMFIGTAFNILLLGIMLTQVYLYFITYKNDNRWIKVFVAGLVIADILNTCFDLAFLYRTLIIQFGNMDALAKADWLFACDPALGAIIVLAVQLFFAWRVYILTKTPAWAIVIVLAALTAAVGGITTAVDVMRIPLFVEFQKFQSVVIVWSVAEVVADVITTAILVLFLRNRKTGFHRSDMMVDKIIKFTVQTGLITTILAAFHLAFYLSEPTGLHLMFNFPLCKMYSNSVMSSLNSRRGLNSGSGVNDSQVMSTGVDSVKSRPAQFTATKNNEVLGIDHRSNTAEVYVHVESHELHDRLGGVSEKQLDRKFKDSQWSAV